VLVIENRLVTDPRVVTVPETPPPKAMLVPTERAVSGAKVAEPVPVVRFAGPCVNWLSTPGVENSTTLTAPSPAEPAPPVASAQSFMVHVSQVTT